MVSHCMPITGHRNEAYELSKSAEYDKTASSFKDGEDMRLCENRHAACDSALRGADREHLPPNGHVRFTPTSAQSRLQEIRLAMTSILAACPSRQIEPYDHPFSAYCFLNVTTFLDFLKSIGSKTPLVFSYTGIRFWRL